jgi:hypothetical protein
MTSSSRLHDGAQGWGSEFDDGLVATALPWGRQAVLDRRSYRDAGQEPSTVSSGPRRRQALAMPIDVRPDQPESGGIAPRNPHYWKLVACDVGLRVYINTRWE